MILEVYGFFFEVKIFVILDDDFKEVDKVLKNFFFKLKEKDGDIVFNMIFGRKVLVVVVIIYSWELNVREIFYMVFFDVQFLNRFYMMFLMYMQVFKNFLGDGNGG